MIAADFYSSLPFSRTGCVYNIHPFPFMCLLPQICLLPPPLSLPPTTTLSTPGVCHPEQHICKSPFSLKIIPHDNGCFHVGRMPLGCIVTVQSVFFTIQQLADPSRSRRVSGVGVIYYPLGNYCADAVIWLKDKHCYLENSVRENKGVVFLSYLKKKNCFRNLGAVV